MDWSDRYFEAWNSHDARRVAEFMTDDATYEDLALGVTHAGHENIRAFVAEAHDFSSDYRFDPVSAQQSGDQYCLEWEMHGTNTGAGGGLPATNKPFRVRGVSVGQLESGKIKSNKDYWNMADYLVQVGLMPMPASAAH